MKRVLAVISVNPDYLQFGVPELKSLLEKFKVPFPELFKEELIQPAPNFRYQINHKTLKNFPYLTLCIPDFQMHSHYLSKFCSHAVMVSKLILLIAQGNNYQELLHNKDEQILSKKCRNWQDSIACDFQSRNRMIDRKQQIQCIDKVLGKMDVRGKINISTATKRFQLIEDHQWYYGHHETEYNHTLKHVYFGLELSNNRVGKLKFNSEYELKKRIYLGPTSIDNDLGFMMCRQGCIDVGSLVYDPFVGTGGMLIPCASFGAITFGSDLDMRVLNGYSVGRINTKSPYYSAQHKMELLTPKINLNFEQYRLEMPNIFRMDSTKPNLRKIQIFDAIITDPPYGLRAMSRSLKPQNQSQQINKNKIISKEQIIEEKLQSLKIEENIKQVQKVLSKKNSHGEEQMNHEQMQKKKRRELQRENKKIRNNMAPQEQKEMKKQVYERLNKERLENWGKYDKNKIENTHRNKIFQGTHSNNTALLQMATLHLKPKGRLVFLYPLYEDEEFQGIKSLPDFDGFHLIDMSENKLTSKNSRILVTMEKYG